MMAWNNPLHADGVKNHRLRLGMEAHVSLPLFALSLLLVVWLTTLHLIGAARAAARSAAIASTSELLDTYEAQVARNLGAIEQTLKTVDYAVKRRGSRAALAELEQASLLPSGLVFSVSIADTDGAIVAAHPPQGARSVGATALFRHHLDSGSSAPFVSQSRLDAAGQHWRLHFSTRLADAQGRFVGVALVDVDPGYFTSAYEAARLGQDGVLGLLGEDGLALALRVGEHESSGMRVAIPADVVAAAKASSWDGVARYAAGRAMRGFPLRVLVGLSDEEQSAGYRLQRSRNLWQAGLLSAALGLLVALFWYWSREGARTRRSIRLAQETYAAASETNKDAFLVFHSLFDKAGAISDFQVSAANSQAEKLTGISRQVLLRLPLSGWMPHSAANGVFDKLVRAASAGGVHEAEYQNTVPQLRADWLYEQLVGVEGGVVAIIRDVSERKQAEDKIVHMAQHDSLTGMPNRVLLQTRLDEAIRHAGRRRGAVLVAFVDLDNFKVVNDGLGHSAGDVLLVEIANRMRHCLRRQDTLARVGGDEFVLVLPTRHERRDDCVLLLERINAAVSRPVLIDGHEVKVSCSIGAAVYPQDGEAAETLLVQADAAMYRAKSAGKNNFQFYTQEMNASAASKLVLLAALRGALEARQLRVVYQPKVDVVSGLMFGVEALLRWQHPERGMISPAEFIPLAEESGLIIEIGRWVLQTACDQSVAWQRAGLAPLTVSVNVSPRQFDDRRLLSDVEDVLRSSGLAPALLELEVTEGLIMRDLAQAVEKMARLRGMGLSLSIDDFGTGYSSLSALKSFPISRLKIDQSFVRDLAASAEDQAIARAIIALGHQLRLRVIAEGVETPQQYDFLRDSGCDEIQGYLFSRPVAPPEIERLLSAQTFTQASASLIRPRAAG